MFTNDEPFSITASMMVTKRTEDNYFIYLSEDVKIIHGTAVITGDSGFANENTGMIEIIGNVKIIDKGTVITSERAIYWKFEKIAQTVGSSHLINGPSEIFAEKLSYFRIDRISSAYLNVLMIDKDNSAVLIGDTGIYLLNEDYGIIYGNPELISEEDGDSFVVMGDTMENFADSGYYKITGNVSAFRENMYAESEIMFYYPENEKVYLIGNNPWIKNGESKLWGDSLIFWMDEKSIIKIESYFNAGGNFSENNTINNIECDTLFLFFSDNKPRYLEVKGNINGTYITETE